jgi:hypothetical protein|tara:strand:+ start:156 stop:599 length:444 start_codon:yes stop_codon:yes gene_type:complete
VEGNDIQTFAPIQQACLFEGVLASPPSKTITKMRASKALRQHEWNRYIGMWLPHEMPLKSLVDSVRRRGIGVEVYTCLPSGTEDAIDQWLFRKGVSVPVYHFDDITEIAAEMKYHSPSMRVHVATDEQAQVLGLRARVASPHSEWVL